MGGNAGEVGVREIDVFRRGDSAEEERRRWEVSDVVCFRDGCGLKVKNEGGGCDGWRTRGSRRKVRRVETRERAKGNEQVQFALTFEAISIFFHIYSRAKSGTVVLMVLELFLAVEGLEGVEEKRAAMGVWDEFVLGLGSDGGGTGRVLNPGNAESWISSWFA